ncbi:MAG: hypothetical protein KBD23_00820 [Gammaproteobacteria bacterium]|nr:hypothetical protein [Gammaproteobacteria bacterium]MBP9728671.1 hypothetical protein [Gammaproteobacteria bacterium]
MILSHTAAIFSAMLTTFLLLSFQLVSSLIQWRKARKQVYEMLLKGQHLGGRKSRES